MGCLLQVQCITTLLSTAIVSCTVLYKIALNRVCAVHWGDEFFMTPIFLDSPLCNTVPNCDSRKVVAIGFRITVRGIHRSPVDYPEMCYKCGTYILLLDSLIRMSDNNSSCRWFGTPWRTCYVTVVFFFSFIAYSVDQIVYGWLNAKET